MIVAVMTIDLFSENCHSLKEKRRILSSVKEKIRKRFNVSLIESDYQDLWQKIQITIVMAANRKAITEKSFAQIEELIFSNYGVQIIETKRMYL